MKQKIILLKASLWLMLLIAAFHTFFIITGGPPLPTTQNFLDMQEMMKSIKIDSGGGIMRTTQNFMDGFNIIVSIFLFSAPVFSLLMLSEIKDNMKAVNKLASANFLAFFAFFLTSLTLLAVGGTILSGVVCLLLLGSLIKKP